MKQYYGSFRYRKTWPFHKCRVNRRVYNNMIYLKTEKNGNPRILMMNKEDNICWFHGKLTREVAEQILKIAVQISCANSTSSIRCSGVNMISSTFSEYQYDNLKQ
ncbi:hypothetical protein ANN_22337 [Periplaneta americana]|uniref:Uncharacterized protein n=1 Tax=Periplaneta americana TaxID=6978 RepID=A0ABQ8S866_PERAM|nr:hypothetical protein ANN_22337 [Periplaneta americana]